MNENIRFKDMTMFATPRKTKVFEVFSTHSDVPLGFIRWHGPWRQYVFEPYKDTFYSGGCMQEIQDKIKQEMTLWRKSK